MAALFRLLSMDAMSSRLDALLDKKKVTLREVLEEDELLQELKGGNQRLIEFLTSQESLTGLIKYVTREAEESSDDQTTQKYPQVATEIFLTQSVHICRAVVGSEELMSMLFSFIYQEAPLPHTLADYFRKVVLSLIFVDGKGTVDYLKKNEGHLEHLINHIGNPPITDMISTFITGGSDPDHTEFEFALEWMASTNIVERLVEKLHSDAEDDAHPDVAKLMCGILDKGAAKLQDSMVNNVDMIVELILGSDVRSKRFIHGVDVIKAFLNREVISFLKGVDGKDDGDDLNLMYATRAEDDSVEWEFDHPGDADEATPAEEVAKEDEKVSEEAAAVDAHFPIFEKLSKHLEKFLVILAEENTSSVRTPSGEIKPVFGAARLTIISFIASVAALYLQITPAVVDELDDVVVKAKLPEFLLSAFLTYRWNNILHHFLLNACTDFLRCPSMKIKKYFFEGAGIHKTILEAVRLNNEFVARGETRIACMAHIMKLASVVIEVALKSDELRLVIDESDCVEDWTSFIEKEYNVFLENDKPLAGGLPDDFAQSHVLPMGEMGQYDMILNDEKLLSIAGLSTASPEGDLGGKANSPFGVEDFGHDYDPDYDRLLSLTARDISLGNYGPPFDLPATAGVPVAGEADEEFESDDEDSDPELGYLRNNNQDKDRVSELRRLGSWGFGSDDSDEDEDDPEAADLDSDSDSDSGSDQEKPDKKESSTFDEWGNVDFEFPQPEIRAAPETSLPLDKMKGLSEDELGVEWAITGKKGQVDGKSSAELDQEKKEQEDLTVRSVTKLTPR